MTTDGGASMSVAARVHFKSPDRRALYVPFATEVVFCHYWLPAAKRHGLQWIPRFEDGATVPLDDLPSVLAEVKQIRADFARSPGTARLLSRVDDVVDALSG